MTILSILIPTIPERGEMFTKLYNEVMNQVAYMRTVHPSLGEIEVLVDDSKRFLDGGLSIGKKREALVQRASGKYLCFLDDDDWISPDYLETLVRMCNEGSHIGGPDVCVFNSFCELGNYWMLVTMDLIFHNQDSGPGVITRRPWHICPVRSEIAKRIPFNDISYAEDWAWMEQVLAGCEKQAKSDRILHKYHHGKHSEADKITNHELLSKSGTASNP